MSEYEDTPVDDGSNRPLGHQTDDGELEVRRLDNGEKCYHETALGAHNRWMRQAPDLFEKYDASLERLASQAAEITEALIKLEAAEAENARLRAAATEIENKFYVAGQMDAQGHAAEKFKVGSGGPILALSKRLLAQARALLAPPAETDHPKKPEMPPNREMKW